MKDLEILIVLRKCLIVEQGGLSIHLLDSDPGVTHQHMALAEKSACHLGFSVDNVAKLDLLLAKFLLVLLQPRLVVLDEEVDGVSLGQECRPESCILDIARDWSNHKLLPGRPSGVRGWATRLEPVLALAMLVRHRHQRVVWHFIKRWFCLKAAAASVVARGRR